MPYGASELLADQDERMARATLTAMGLIALAIAVAGTIAALAPHERGIPFVLPAIRHPLLPPPSITQPAQAFAPPAAPSPHAVPHAIPVPTPDAQILLPPAPATRGSGTDLGKSGPAVPGNDEISPQQGDGEGVRPQPQDFVYVDELPVLIKSAPITYPDMARDAGVEGRVVVLMLVGKDGHVLDVRVDPKHSVPMLDAAALDCARSCVFKPALSSDHPVMVWVQRPFEFRLH
jgi:protein TonB